MSFWELADGPVDMLRGFLTASDMFTLRLCSRATWALTELWRQQGELGARVVSYLAARLGVDVVDELRAFMFLYDVILRGSFLLHALLPDDLWRPQELHFMCEQQPSLVPDLLRIFGGTGFSALNVKRVHNIAEEECSAADGVVRWRVTYLEPGCDPTRQVAERTSLGFLALTFNGVGLVVHDVSALRTRSSHLRLGARDTSLDSILLSAAFYEHVQFKVCVQHVTVVVGKDDFRLELVLLVEDGRSQATCLRLDPARPHWSYLEHLSSCLRTNYFGSKWRISGRATERPCTSWAGLLPLPTLFRWLKEDIHGSRHEKQSFLAHFKAGLRIDC
jgi:hypothetical protein